MYIKKLQLINFRNYDDLLIELHDGINVLVGDNAQGKTNILESIYYCSLGKSHRTSKDKELIKWDSDKGYISTYVCKKRLDKKIDIKISKEGKKEVKVNSIKLKMLSDLIGVLNVVIFSPEDLKIVKESPSYRRKFLDIELSKLNKKYYYSLVNYNKALSQRNILLKKWNKNKEIIEAYDCQLIKYGSFIIRERLRYITSLNLKAKVLHKEITLDKENINLKYITHIKRTDHIEEQFYEILKNNINKDMEKGSTSFGPHRDDFSISINNIDTRTFGSQGQQRTAALTIKLASLEIIKDLTGEYPVLLLDDVLSELDINRQKYILNSIKKFQTIITGTGIINISDYLEDHVRLFKVTNGTVLKQ